MVVRVIDSEPDPSVVKRAVCRRGCGATVEYVPNDVQEHHGTDYGGGPDGMKWVDCPKCDERIVLESW